ncbi:hypothetical protein [Pendulispora albinea]|uniref:Uncharacterized protein n=1 Tax=Pendulispora albinea TaxID=2741071 RepID=A0ABZ2M0M9_9BACT
MDFEGGWTATGDVPDAGADSGTSGASGKSGDAEATESPFALVQQGTKEQTSKTVTIAMGQTGTGNLIVVVIGQGTNRDTTVTSIVDDAPGGSNAYVSTRQRSIDTADVNTLEIWYAANIRPGATSATVTMQDSVRVMAWVMEFSGPSKSETFDTGSVLNNQPRGTTIIAPVVIPSTPTALVISAAMSAGEISELNAGSPFQRLPIVSGNNVAYFFATKPGSYSAVWSSENATWNASTVAFK